LHGSNREFKLRKFSDAATPYPVLSGKRCLELSPNRSGTGIRNKYASYPRMFKSSIFEAGKTRPVKNLNVKQHGKKNCKESG
jgi:hypothetical protein